MAKKFLSDIELDAGLVDVNGNTGTSGQILSSTGTGVDWISQDDITAGQVDKALSLTLQVKNTESVALTKGQVVCAAPTATPPSGNVIEVKLADNNGTDSMPVIGILNEGLDAAGGANDEGEAIMFGRISGIDTSAFSVGDEVFVSDTPGGLTATKPTGVKYIQKVGVIMRDDASNGTIEVFGAGRTNDVPTPLYIDHANQRLGIRKTSPSSELHINNDSALPQLTLSNAPATGYGGGGKIIIEGGTGDYVYGSIEFENGGSRDARFAYSAASREMSFRVNERGISGQGYFRFYNETIEIAEINASGIYGNVFYDQGNSGYYVNPASTGNSFNALGYAHIRGGITTDGSARSYTWRALDNTASSSTRYQKIARITSSQSSRFIIELAGRSTSYDDVSLPAMGYIVGQLNNDNNYDLVFYNHSGEDTVVDEVGQVDVSTTATDIYIKVSFFSEVTAHAHISDGTIAVDSTSAGSTEPSDYIAATNITVWNSRNDGSGSGLDADLLDGNHASDFASSSHNHDSDYVNVTGDTMTGNLILEDSELHVGDTSGDNWTRIKHAQADGYGFDWQHDNATVLVNEQGSTNQALVLGDVDAGDYTGLLGVAHSTNAGTSWTKKLDLRGNGELYIGASGTSRAFHDGYHPNADTWTTARTITIGSTGKSVNGSANVSWTLAEIGIASTELVKNYQNVNYVASDPTSSGSRTNYGVGVTVYEGYNGGSNRPHTYDATVQFMPASAQGFELSASWISTTTTPLKIRSLRDCCNGWSPWVDVAVSGTTSSGTFQTTGSYRAPVFYDSDNTSYYVNPSSTATSAALAGRITIGELNTANSADNWSIKLIENSGNCYIGNHNGAAQIQAGGYLPNATGTTVQLDAGTQTYAGIWASEQGKIHLVTAYSSTAGGTPNYDVGFTMNNDGDVGIGTTSPGARLHVSSGTANEDCVVIIESDTDNNDETSNPRLELRQDAGGVVGRLGYRNNTNSLELINQYAEALYLGTSNTTDLTILSNGKVGIGTTSPNQKLTIKGTDQYVAAEQTNYVWGGTTTIGVRMGTDATAGLLDFRRWTGSATTHGTALITQANLDGGYGLDFRVDTQSSNTVATTSRMFLSASGEVGIGTTSPSQKLHVSSGDQSTARIRLSNTNTSSGGDNIELVAGVHNVTQDGFSIYNASGGVTQFVIQGGGNVGIGKEAPSEALDVDGSITSNATIWTGYDAGVTNSISCSGWFRSSGSTGWYNATYGGGIYMVDSTWVRAYNNKKFYADNTIESNSGMYAPIFYDRNNTGYFFNGDASKDNVDLVTGSNYAINVLGTISGGHRKHGNLETPEMQFSVGGSTDLNWKKLFDVVTGDASYSGWGAEIEITDFSGNFGSATYSGGELYKGALSIYHWGGTGTTPETPYANIPYALRNNVRWYKIQESGQNRYQLQVKSVGNYQQLYIKVKPGIGNQVADIISYANDTNGATSGGTAYTSTQAVNFNHEFAGGIWTNDGRTIGWKNAYGSPYLSSYYGSIFTSTSFYVGSPFSTTTQLYAGPVSGTIYYDRNNTTYYVDPNSTGDSIRVAGDVVAYYSSDKRLKDNIKPIENALDKVKAISGVTFEWNEKSHKTTGKKDVGVVAQEIEAVLPELVETRTNGYKAVDYQKLTAVLIESVKELTAKVEALENKQCNCK